MDYRFSHWRWIAALLTLLLWTGAAGSLLAETVSASALLSSATASVGEPVKLELTITGATQSDSPPEVRVEGLSIQYNGQSSRYEMNNFSVTSSVTHTYTVLPQREGTFTIPALRVAVGGKTVATKPLTLVVSRQNPSAANAPAQGGQQGQQDQGSQDPQGKGGRMAFAEWVLPKTTAYVGETLPAELRLYLAANVRWSLQQLPTVAGDGFIVQNLPQKPQESNVTKEGQPYHMVVFKTALSPVKVGKLTLPATEIDAVAQVPRKRQTRPRVQGFPDMFNDPFFDDAFGAVQQEVKVETDPVDMEVKPLPSVGKPKSFSGGVGQFTLQTKASPLQVHAGDPITVTAEVSGMGSFDRMGPPAIADEPGWRAYPPSAKFKADDQVGLSGTKTFETAIIPDGPKDALPAIEFSYFDPSREKYVTLTGERIPVSVQGSATASPTPEAAATASGPAPTAASHSPAATPAPKVNDIFFIRTDGSRWGVTFQPEWRTRRFWLAQLAPLAALLAWGGWQARRTRLGNLRARRLAALRQAKAEAARVLRQGDATPQAFYDAAVQVFQLEAALGLAAERVPGTLDAEAVCAARPLDAETALAIRDLFAAHDRARYAGAGGGGSEGIAPERRERVLEILEKFEKSHA